MADRSIWNYLPGAFRRSSLSGFATPNVQEAGRVQDFAEDSLGYQIDAGLDSFEGRFQLVPESVQGAERQGLGVSLTDRSEHALAGTGQDYLAVPPAYSSRFVTPTVGSTLPTEATSESYIVVPEGGFLSEMDSLGPMDSLFRDRRYPVTTQPAVRLEEVPRTEGFKPDVHSTPFVAGLEEEFAGRNLDSGFVTDHRPAVDRNWPQGQGMFARSQENGMHSRPGLGETASRGVHWTEVPVDGFGEHSPPIRCSSGWSGTTTTWSTQSPIPA